MKAKYFLKKGVTFIALLATIVIMIILATTIIVSSKDIISNTNRKEFAKEIYAVQKQVEKYKFSNSKYPVKDTQIEFTISNLYAEQFSGESITDSKVILKEIDLTKADIETLKHGKKANNEAYDVYAVSETTGKVYYLKGYSYKSTVYYTLTSELLKTINMSK